MRNEEECVCSVPNCCDKEQRPASNILISGKIFKEMPGSVASRTPCISQYINPTDTVSDNALFVVFKLRRVRNFKDTS